MLPVFRNTVKPLLSGHPLDLAKSPFNRGCLLKRVDFFPFSDKPAFTIYPRSQTVREGDNVTLFCNATGNPEPHISWTIDGLTMNITVHPRISLSSNNKQLTVKNVSRTDVSHEFRCQANNSVETITSDAASLTVQCEYDTMILRLFIVHHCFTLFPLLIAGWHKECCQQDKSYSSVFIILQYQDLSIAEELVIHTSKNTVDFFPFSDKPAFTAHPQNQIVREGDNVTLFCNATGNPEPTISWTIDGLTVNITVHPRISLSSDNKQLTVRNVNRTDMNHKYRCEAKNSVEKITSDAASLTVQCE